EEYPGVASYQASFAVSLLNSAQLSLVRDKNLAQARKLLERAVGTYRPLVRAYPENQHYVHHLINSCLLLSGALAALGDAQGAAKWLREAEDVFCDSIVALQRLPRGSFRVASLCLDVAEELEFSFGLWSRAGRPREAAAIHQQITQLYGRTLARTPGNAGVLLGRGDAYRRLRRMDEALADYQQAAGLLEKEAMSHATAEHQKQLATSLNNLADLLKVKGRFGEAEEAARKALAWWRRLAADSPEEPTCRFGVGDGLFRLGKVLAAAQRHQEAEQLFRQAAAIFQPLAAEFPDEPGFLLMEADTFRLHLGPLLAGQPARLRDAEEAYRHGIAAGERLAARFPELDREYHRRLGNAYHALMNLLRSDGRRDAAMQVGRQARDFYKRLAVNHPKETSIHAELARFNKEMSRLLQAVGQPGPAKPTQKPD
ncbi:MAG TPA: tetratricopeptide repeat protein, partial [Gemmataceae bacterium]|nr:tetratricopeptide repeat protein [Gemmataceae bacterium]